MKSKSTKLALIACSVLCCFFACAPDIEMPPPPPQEELSSSSETPSSSSSHFALSSSSLGGLSSSSVEVLSSSNTTPSSSSVLAYNYCVFLEEKICLLGPMTSCPSGGVLSNNCPYGSSSSVPPSSSSVPQNSSSSFAGTSGTFIDDRDGKSYKWVKIGEQYWMAENLNYNAPDSKCGNGSSLTDVNTATCDTYGRLYNWATAMDLPSSCNTSSCTSQISAKHKGVCPSGWHIPSGADWNALMKSVNPSCSDNSTCTSAGTKLKTTNGWNSGGNGTDDYGFTALPGGGGGSNGSFSNLGDVGNWWSSLEYGNANYAYNRYMYNNNESTLWGTDTKSSPKSIRCLQD
jgi:uncharacterized protein (TIGR02145 family)